MTSLKIVGQIIRGQEVVSDKQFSISDYFGDAQCIVKKCHTVCGDSAFVYLNNDKAMLAVFDGVSGEAGADKASSFAAESIFEELKDISSPSEKQIKKALVNVHTNIDHGFTTALIVVILPSGSYLAASVGDSSLYSIDKKGQVDLEIPLSRIIGDGDNKFRYFLFRDIVRHALGWTKCDLEIMFQKGKLSNGEILILTSDGLSDNLKIKISEDKIQDASGRHDLKKIIGAERSPEKITKALYAEFKKRSKLRKKTETKGFILAPKLDDLALVVFRFRKQ